MENQERKDARPTARALNLYLPWGLRAQVAALQDVLRANGTSLSAVLRPELERLVDRHLLQIERKP